MRYFYFLMTFIVLLSFSGCWEDEKLVYKKGRYKRSQCHNHDSVNYTIDKIVVDKSQRKMYLYDGLLIRDSFRISLSRKKGKKLKVGDLRVPEGKYRITQRRCHSKYYKMIRISYPNQDDRRVASKAGVFAGSGITIHAQPFWNGDGKGNNYTLSKDWTKGCIALTNKDMDTFWNSVARGTPIEIKP